MNTFKLGLDFDWIFVRNLPNLKMSNNEYLTKIKLIDILKLKESLFKKMAKSEWYIITGRKLYLKKITIDQLKKVVPKEYMKNFKGIYFKDNFIPDYKFKINKCLELWIDIYIESEKKQALKISKELHCIYYKEL